MWFYACHQQVIHYEHVAEIFQVENLRQKWTKRIRGLIIVGLINNAIIDWFLPWPEQALYAVSTSLLSEDVSFIMMKERERFFIKTFYFLLTF
jgi:hypothetical protein